MKPDKASEDTTLKKLLKSYYGQYKIPEKLKGSILPKYGIDKHDSSMVKHFNFFKYHILTNSARYWTGLITASIMIFSIGWYLNTSISTTNRINSIAKEVSTNHLKNLPFDVQLNNDSDVVQYFDKQDFKPILPDLRYPDLKLIGGRYCSIQGETAIFLTYNHQKTGKRYSLYLFKMPDGKAINNSRKITRVVNNVKVILWSEGILSYSLASG